MYDVFWCCCSFEPPNEKCWIFFFIMTIDDLFECSSSHIRCIHRNAVSLLREFQERRCRYDIFVYSPLAIWHLTQRMMLHPLKVCYEVPNFLPGGLGLNQRKQIMQHIYFRLMNLVYMVSIFFSSNFLP